jgi:hypothetical protein
MEGSPSAVGLTTQSAVVYAVLYAAGTYDTAEEAALVYDAACRELRGPHTAISNFPDADEQTIAE